MKNSTVWSEKETKGYQTAAKLSAALVSALAARDVNISADVATTALENNNAITMGIVVGVSRAVQNTDIGEVLKPSLKPQPISKKLPMPE